MHLYTREFVDDHETAHVVYYRTQVRSLPCLVSRALTGLVEFVQIVEFVKVGTWICQNLYMDFSKLLHGFVKIDTWISRSLLNKTKLTFDQDFKAC